MKKTCKECGGYKNHEAHGLCKTCYNKKWKKANPEKYKEHIKRATEKRRRNKEKNRQYTKEWCKKNKKRKKIYNKIWYQKNKKKVKMNKKKWQEENQEKVRMLQRKYDLQRRANGIIKKRTIDRILNENIFKYGIITCEKCKKQCKDNYHIDHIIPASKGGNNSYNNLQILCPICNMEKFTKIADYRKDKKNNQLFLRI